MPNKTFKIKVGPEYFVAEFRDPASDGMLNDGNYGYTLDLGNLIVVSSTISKSKQRVTLMHEILHAARMILEGPTLPKSKAKYEDWEHHFIGIYENAFIMLLQDNPELVEWLREE